MARMICASFFPATDLSRDPDSEHEHPNLGAGLLDTVQQCLERRSVTVDPNSWSRHRQAVIEAGSSV